MNAKESRLGLKAPYTRGGPAAVKSTLEAEATPVLSVQEPSNPRLCSKYPCLLPRVAQHVAALMAAGCLPCLPLWSSRCLCCVQRRAVFCCIHPVSISQLVVHCLCIAAAASAAAAAPLCLTGKNCAIVYSLADIHQRLNLRRNSMVTFSRAPGTVLFMGVVEALHPGDSALHCTHA